MPEWLRWTWAAVFVYIAVAHGRHGIVMYGRHRWWHATHTLMALGVAYVFLPSNLMHGSLGDVSVRSPTDARSTPHRSTPKDWNLRPVPVAAWQLVFVVAAIVIAAFLVRAWVARRAANLLWAVALLGMLAMVYMFALPARAIAPLTYALVVYYAMEAVIWSTGGFDDLARRRRGLPFAIGPTSAGSVGAEPLVGASPPHLRATLATMATGIGYMFVVMQVGP